LGVAFAVPHEEGIEVRHARSADRLIRLDEAGATLVWAILQECDGYSPLERVVAKVHKRFPDRDVVMIRDVLDDLLEEGVLMDSRAAFPAFHQLTENPPPFGRALSAVEVIAYTSSRRLPVAASGPTYEIGQLPTALAHLQAARHSCRSFGDRRLGLRELGHLLTSGYRIPSSADTSAATPSGGALYPLKMYVICSRSGGDPPAGLYEYDPEPANRPPDPSGGGGPRRRLVRMDLSLDEAALGFGFDTDATILPYGAPVAVVIAADMLRDPYKYANRGYRYTLIEAGLALQNIVMAAAEIGVASLPFGGFRDQPLVRELEMDRVPTSTPGRVLPLITVLLGYPGNTATPGTRELVDALETELVGPGKPITDVRWHVSTEQGSFVVATAPTRGATNRRHRAICSGRAPSTALAKLRALAEGLERYSAGVVRVDREASASGLDDIGASWLDPRAAAPLSQDQYAAMPWLQPFSERDVLQWVEGHRAGSGQPVLVPVDLAYYPVDTTRWQRKPLIIASSNGMAAYTSEIGAVERGLLELLERDAMMRNWFHRDPVPQIPIELLPYHWQRRVDYWRQHDRDVHVLDLSAEAHGAVVVEVVITSNTDTQPCFMSGAGVSLVSFEEAVEKGFHEAEFFTEQIINRPFRRRIRPELVTLVHEHAQLYSFPDQRESLEWLFAGDQTTRTPQPSTNLPRLLTEFDPVVVRLAPLNEKIDTVAVPLSPTARRLMTNAPLSVVHVISEHLIPIHFGYGTGHYTQPTLNGRVAPESIWRPQYFA
jgi:thiazole/oxazole-forming peptide maturase SagD family component